MDITNDTGFPHFQFEKVGYYGELFTVVVVSQTFKISPSSNTCLVANTQRSPVMMDTWHGEPEYSSLKTVTDLVCKKIQADVLLMGHAWHAGGNTAHWQAEIHAGSVHRHFAISGPRKWQYINNSWQLSEPELTDKVPLFHELAPFTEYNPVGITFPDDADKRLTYPAPQLSVSPGAVCRSWPSRLRYARGFTAEWNKKIRPFYPDEFDFAFMNYAPPEQKYEGYLKGNEKIVVTGLLPSRREFSCYLPGIRLLAHISPHASVNKGSALRPLLADTLTVYTDEEIITLTWRLTLPANDLPQQIVLVAEQGAVHG